MLKLDPERNRKKISNLIPGAQFNLKNLGAREMAEWLRSFVVFLENLSLPPVLTLGGSQSCATQLQHIPHPLLWAHISCIYLPQHKHKCI